MINVFQIQLTDEAAVKEAALSSSQPDLVEQFERIITTWAYAYDIDGAARNDLFKRLRTNAQPAPDAGLVVDEQILLILDEQIALWHSSNCELHEWLGWTEAEFHDWVADPTKIPRLPQYALTSAGGGCKVTHLRPLKLDHEPFQVTRESIENLPDWAKPEACRTFIKGWCFYSERYDELLEGDWNDYLVAYWDRIEVWTPEQVAERLAKPVC